MHLSGPARRGLAMALALPMLCCSTRPPGKPLRRTKQRVFVIGFDGMEEARNAVDKEPNFVGVIRQYPDKMGTAAVVSRPRVNKAIPAVALGSLLFPASADGPPPISTNRSFATAM